MFIICLLIYWLITYLIIIYWLFICLLCSSASPTGTIIHRIIVLARIIRGREYDNNKLCYFISLLCSSASPTGTRVHSITRPIRKRWVKQESHIRAPLWSDTCSLFVCYARLPHRRGYLSIIKSGNFTDKENIGFNNNHTFEHPSDQRLYLV